MNYPILDLESIKGMPMLSKSMCDWMLDCGVYSFHIQNHSSGVTLEVEIDGTKKEYTVVWEVDAQSLQKSMNDFNRTTDYGAMCVCLLWWKLIPFSCRKRLEKHRFSRFIL